MTPGQLLLRSLSHFWRVHVAVAMGVAAATAVLTGALLVGDSVRGSLRDLTLDRLGQIDQLLLVDRFFSTDLVDRLASGDRFAAFYKSATPAMIIPQGTIESRTAMGTERAAGILVVGADEPFWRLQSPGQTPPRTLPGDEQVVLNEPLANELGVKIGDSVVLRLPKANQVPADSALGRKTDLTRSLTALKVVDIIPARGFGRFSLQPSQHLPRNAYLSLATLQAALQSPQRANAILVSRQADQTDSTLNQMLSPSLDDLGLKIEHVQRTFKPEGESEQVAFEYYQLSSNRLVIEPEIAGAANRAWGEYGAQPVMTYLANSIRRVDESQEAPHDGTRSEIPYSIVAALDSTEGLGPLRDEAGQPVLLADDEIVLNRWAADSLGVRPGQRIRLTYFLPETLHGETVERSAEFRLRSVAPLVEPYEGYRLKVPARYRERPALTNDPDLTPTVAGLTDQDSIDKWNPPFPYDSRRMKGQDDEYWNRYRTTPKAFVSLTTGQRLWGSRFGSVTSVRVPAEKRLRIERLERSLLFDLSQNDIVAGLEFQPIKQQSLDASSGTTPFDALFLALSFFLIAAAVMLVALLFRLGIEQRASEIGLLLATGWTPDGVGRQLASEAAVVATLGSIFGLGVGVGYASLLLVGLRTWWLGAVATPFLELHITLRSLLIGFGSGILVATAVIALSLRQTRHASVRQLLAGQFTTTLPPLSDNAGAKKRGLLGGRQVAPWIAASLMILAVGLAFGAIWISGEAQAGCFVAAGLCVLSGLLIGVNYWLRVYGPRGATTADTVRLDGLFGLALRNAARNPGRSTATIGLVGIAVFLIVALSAFRLDPSAAGGGGFDLMAESSLPIFQDLMSADVRRDLLADRANVLDGAAIFALRLRPGDDASCSNLYQARQPRVLGVPVRMIEYFDEPRETPFEWAASSAADPATRANPWRALRTGPADDDAPIPVVLDKNTALYGLHLYGGIGQIFTLPLDEGRELRLEVVGLLANSVLQGAVLMSENEFVRVFPTTSGYRQFLIRSPRERSDEVAAVLEDRLGDQGFDARSTRSILAGFLAVQNTYLSTFQSLGALGLLLGTFGLVTVQVRSVVERRGELALLRAAGFRRWRIGELVLGEHLVLLLGGMLAGLGSALLAVLPHGVLGGASLPWLDLVPLLATVLAFGQLAGLIAVRAAVKAPLIGALRGE